MYRVINHLHLEMEHGRQLEKFGKQDHTPDRWLTILVEEVGEVSKEMCNLHDSPCELVRDNYEKELIQVAAVAMTMLENFQEQRRKPLEISIRGGINIISAENPSEIGGSVEKC